MDGKEKRFELEGQIITLIFDDNRNTVHFDYHVNIDVFSSVRLDLFTRNAVNGAVFLLHQTKGTSSIDVLEQMISFLKTQQHIEEKYSFTVKWKKTSEKDGEEHTSYFYGATEKDVMDKFYFKRLKNEYEIILIEKNPLS